MKEEEAVKIFDLVVKEHMLPATLDKLVPLIFISDAAEKFYDTKIHLMKQLGMAKDQLDATLKDGQAAGRMRLKIYDKVGELADQEPRASTKPLKGTAKGGGSLPSGLPPKPERLGLKQKQMEHAKAIHDHPAAVAAIIKEAEENEDIPTKTAVLNKIKGDKAQEQLKAFREKHDKEPSPVLAEYLEKSIEHLIQVNSVVKQFFAYPDQVDAKRMKELVRQVKILVDIISSKTGRESWKQLA